MTDYQKMYTTLFNAVTDALEKMEVQNYGDRSTKDRRDLYHSTELK